MTPRLVCAGDGAQGRTRAGKSSATESSSQSKLCVFPLFKEDMYVCVYICLQLCMCTMSIQCPRSLEGSVGAPGVGVVDGWELPGGY